MIKTEKWQDQTKKGICKDGPELGQMDREGTIGLVNTALTDCQF